MREDVEETLDVIRKAGFDNAFTFVYSKRTGTPAAAMAEQVPEAQVRQQFDRVLRIVQETARKQAGRLLGRVEEVLVEEQNAHEESLMTGRLSCNMLVHFPGGRELIGQYVTVSLDECRGFYYMGKRR